MVALNATEQNALAQKLILIPHYQDLRESEWGDSVWRFRLANTI